MYCRMCGKEIPEGMNECPDCGKEVLEETEIKPEKELVKEENETKEKNQPEEKGGVAYWGPWKWFSICSVIVSVIMLIIGFNKMFRYDNGEHFPYEYINAYVSGDAYNYIINGTYATAYFVLAGTFLLAAIGLLVLDYLSEKKEAEEKKM